MVSPAPRGAVVWITGLPSSGKSTFAERLQRRLLEAGLACCTLDGDAVRHALVPAPGYTPEARDAFYATLAGLAALLAAQGLVVVVPATAHRAAYRAEARRVAPRFVEVYVAVDAGECRRRDAKGLYAATGAGLAVGLPGADSGVRSAREPGGDRGRRARRRGGGAGRGADRLRGAGPHVRTSYRTGSGSDRVRAEASASGPQVLVRARTRSLALPVRYLVLSRGSSCRT